MKINKNSITLEMTPEEYRIVEFALRNHIDFSARALARAKSSIVHTEDQINYRENYLKKVHQMHKDLGGQEHNLDKAIEDGIKFKEMY